MAATAWDITPDVHEFSEAVSWFQKRTVLTATEALALNERARASAFWVGGGLQLQQIQDVFQALDKSIAKGETFDDFRARLKANLKPAHASIVFRNATQRAYNAGRYQQMTQPDVLKFRPFWMYDSVLDSRTTFVCKSYNKTLLLADDPWWHTRIPPNHHGCRASIRSLRRAEAERRGITLSPAAVQPAAGWAVHPLDPIGPPDKKNPRLVEELKKKTVKPVKLRKKTPRAVPSPEPKGPPPEHDPEHWVAHYTPRYGEAAKSVGWGRAMQERGLDMPAAEFLKHWKEVGVESRAVNTLLKRDTKKTLRELGADLIPEVKAAAGTVAHSLAITRRAVAPRYTGLIDPRIAKTRATFERQSTLLADASVQPVGIVVDVAKTTKDSREFQDGFLVQVFEHTDASVVFHEWAHAIEDQNHHLSQRSHAFLSARRGNEPLRRLRDHFPGHDYRDDEVAFADELRSAYIGKKYKHSATEVTSMGVEYLTRSLDYHESHKDMEHLLFTLGQLSGQ